MALGKEPHKWRSSRFCAQDSDDGNGGNLADAESSLNGTPSIQQEQDRTRRATLLGFQHVFVLVRGLSISQPGT